MKNLTLDAVAKVQKQAKKIYDIVDDSGSSCIINISHSGVHIYSLQAFWKLAENQVVTHINKRTDEYPYEAYFYVDGVKYFTISEEPIKGEQ